MTSTSAVGLIGVFLVDLVDIFFLSMLDSSAIISGVGFAATITFFTASISIGISISMGALVSFMIGQGNTDQAKQYVINISVLAFALTSILAGVIWLNLAWFLGLLGASGDSLAAGISYLQIILPSLPLLATGMAMSAALRAVGDAKLSMYSTLMGGLVNAILDPIFIFAFGWGLEGAAIASVVSRFVLLFVAFYGISKKHSLLKAFFFKHFMDDLASIFKIAGPAILTNMATPIGNAIVIFSLAKFGDAYVAAIAVIARLAPVAFALVFALSSAIAPIFGQNLGGKQYARIKQTLSNAVLFNIVYVTLMSLVLFLSQDLLIKIFSLKDEAAAFMRLFCNYIAISFIFIGIQHIANAAFNNLGKPVYATWFNVGKSILGTLPFVFIGSQLLGAPGVLIGQAIGSALFGLTGIWVAKRLTDKIANTKSP